MQHRLFAAALFIDGNVLDQQTQHALFVLGLGAGRMPEPRKILGQRQNLGFLLDCRHLGFMVDEGIIAGLHFIVPLQGLLPTLLERCRHQPVRGIDFQIAALRQLGFVIGTLQSPPPLLRDLRIALFKMLDRAHRKLELCRLEHSQDFGRDRCVGLLTAQRQTAARRQTFAPLMIAFVGWRSTAMALVAHA